MIGLSRLAVYMDTAQVAGLRQSVGRHVRVRKSGQGWTDAQMITSLVMLNFAGGESVDDLRILESDEGLGRVLKVSETHLMRRGERRTERSNWRRQRSRIVPSPSAVFRYLGEFHDSNVPAGYEQLRVSKESMEYLPSGVEQVKLRSDNAGYQ